VKKVVNSISEKFILMKNQSPTTGDMSGSLSSLQQLVSNLVNSFLPTASRNNTQLVNEVRQEISLGVSTNKAVDVIRELLETVITNSNHGEIHITAERFSNTILLQIQERNNNNGYALAYSIGSIEPTALSAGGHISINGPQKRIATISFTFPDQLVA
jgi:hypothetical protein